MRTIRIKTADFLAIINENIASRVKLNVARSLMTSCHTIAAEAAEATAIEDFGVTYSTWYLNATGMHRHEMKCFRLTTDGFRKYKTTAKGYHESKGRWMSPPVYQVVEGMEHEFLEGVILKARQKYYQEQIINSLACIKEKSDELDRAKGRLEEEQKILAEINDDLPTLS